MTCECTSVQRNVPFIGGCWRHEGRQITLALLAFAIIITPAIIYYGGIASEEQQANFRVIDVMGCTELRHYLAGDPMMAETEKAELNFKWKCLEAGMIDMRIDSED